MSQGWVTNWASTPKTYLRQALSAKQGELFHDDAAAFVKWFFAQQFSRRLDGPSKLSKEWVFRHLSELAAKEDIFTDSSR